MLARYRQGGKMAATQMSEWELLDAATEALTRRLPPKWTVERQASAGDTEAADLVIKTPNTQAFILVEVKSNVSRRDVEALTGGPWRRWRRQIGNQPILLVAPYIGPRVRELLTEENVSYLDLTGNTRISLDHPGVFIETEGASQDPRSTKPRAALRGAKAGAVVRVLVDVAPPYTGADIARTANVNEGYLSRILDTLVDEGLIDRERSGPVTRVDWPAMVRRRAQALDLFRVGTHRYVAREGTSALLDRMRGQPAAGRRPPTVTGSFAAARIAPVAAPTLLVIYTVNPRELETDLELLPAEAGADTVLIRPDNNVAFARAERDGGIAWAAPSQVAIDCLAGTGRMPSEGEALIGWMRKNENEWRYPSIRALLADTPGEEG
jgi:MarR family